MRLFDKLNKQLSAYLNKPQIVKIEQAYLFAARAHAPQSRSSGEPYITHPLAVATILADMRMDAETIMAALLHDVVEDTEIDKTVIATHFGNAVADLVDGTSKLAKIKFADKTDAQAENFHKMLLAMVKDIRVILVKLADRLHNMRTITALRLDKRQRIANETLEIYIPIAKRLGMHNMCIELENLCFQSLYPKRYETLANAILAMQGRRKGVIDMIQKALHGALAKHHFKELVITGREKHLYGIYQKMRIKRTSLAQVMDIYAFRIVVKTVEDCYRALGCVHMLYKPVFERFKDYIAIPKINGYQSLHTILFGPYGVPIEVQMRTSEMDHIAARGIAAHWHYKKGHASSYLPNERLHFWLQGLLELQKKSGSSLEFIENVKLDLFPNEIYVFTPKGEIMELPCDATIVDFAYEVHSDVGNYCVAGKIDRQPVPLHTKLSSGQTIEIITSKSARPHALWLNFVVTGKARSNIYHFVKKQQRNAAIELGEHFLISALYSLGAPSIEAKIASLQRVLATTEFKVMEDLYCSIGKGHHNPLLIAQHLTSHPDQPTLSTTVIAPITITGVENLLLHFAKCCLPIPGDAIVGCLEAGQGIFVHARVCRNIVALSEQTEKYFPLRWDKQISGLFFAELRIALYARQGALARVLQQLVEANIDIGDFKILTKSAERIDLKIIAGVENRHHLAKVLCSLRISRDVILISRKVNAKNYLFSKQIDAVG